MAGREDGELGRSKSRGSSRPRGRAPPAAELGGGVLVVAFPLGLARAGRAGWRSRAGLRVRTFPPSLPPSSRAVPGGRANERREEGSGKQTLSAAALLPRPRPLRQRQVCAPRVLRWVASSGSPLGPREPGGRAALGTATRAHSGGRTPSGVARPGAGAAASRRCRMAAEPPPSLSYRTTGSTCLHPLSELLGIPLDQVTAGGRAALGWGGSAGTLPEPERA